MAHLHTQKMGTHGSPAIGIADIAKTKYLSSHDEYIKWLKKAASKEYGPAIMVLALKEESLSHDRGLPKDARETHLRTYRGEIKRAYEGLSNWAKEGDVESMFQLGAYAGTYSKEGLATVRECLPWLEKAALKGHEEAPFNLALALIELDTPTEKAKGFDWLKQSTEKGNSRYQAAARLVHYYSYGFPEIGLKRNAKEAWKWAKKGAELQGSPIENFLEENGLQDPDKVSRGEVLFK